MKSKSKKILEDLRSDTKFYVVCWYDRLDDDLSPCYGENGLIYCSWDKDEELDYVELFTDINLAEAYRVALEAQDKEDYRIVEIDVSDEL